MTKMTKTKIRYSEIKDNIDIDALEAALGFTVLAQDGANDIGYCLFPENHQHGDTTGKFAIHRDKKVYNCWICGGGSLLSLAMELKDLDVDGGTAFLHEFTGNVDNRTDTEFRDYLLELLDDVEERVETIPYFNSRVLDRFDGPLDYFHARGISDSVIAEHHLCYGETVMKTAPKRQKDGQTIKIDDDYYGPAAIFPHYWQGRLVGWQHRWINWPDTPKWLAKYTNTGDFPKHDTLFNYEDALKARQPVSLLESVPSVLFLKSNGWPAVSHFGGDVKDAQLRLLRRFTQGVILCPDNDKTGTSFVNAVGSYLERYIPVWIAEPTHELGEKSDLGDYAGADNATERLNNHLTHQIHPLGVEICQPQ